MNVTGDQPVTKRLTRDQRKTRAAKPRCRGRNGSLQMTGSTKPSDKPSPPVTRYPLFKSLAVASCTRSDAAIFMIAHPRKFQLARHSDPSDLERAGLLPNQRIATDLLTVWLDRFPIPSTNEDTS